MMLSEPLESLGDSACRRKDLLGKPVAMHDGVYRVLAGKPGEHEITVGNGQIREIHYPDGHTEKWLNGYPDSGDGLPAVITDFGSTEEYWTAGKPERVVYTDVELGGVDESQ
jgi:hypothetical protein